MFAFIILLYLNCLHVFNIIMHLLFGSCFQNYVGFVALVSYTGGVLASHVVCKSCLKQMFALTYGTTLQRLPEEVTSEQRKRPMPLFPQQMVWLAHGPAIVAISIDVYMYIIYMQYISY